MESLLAIAFAEELFKADNASTLETFKRIDHWTMQLGPWFPEQVSSSFELMCSGVLASDQAAFFASEAC